MTHAVGQRFLSPSVGRDPATGGHLERPAGLQRVLLQLLVEAFVVERRGGRFRETEKREVLEEHQEVAMVGRVATRRGTAAREPAYTGCTCAAGVVGGEKGDGSN